MLHRLLTLSPSLRKNYSFVKQFHFSSCKFHKNICALQESLRYSEGSTIGNYEVQKVIPVPELSLNAISLTHKNTGANHLHIARNDQNNAFSVAFRTTPYDSTGVAHILEHVVLCGSKKFPCRDPFFKMLTRSMATFMNAYTSADWTMYPFSTQNRQDFDNLMRVYLDSVFEPNLGYLEFLQEGWRLEHSEVHDRTSPIIFKGVVFNEMKGVYSNSQSWFSENIRMGLFPSHTYQHMYGGDPAVIPDLSHDALRNFHMTHYHPSNASFFTYGSFPLEDSLVTIENALSGYSHISVDSLVPSEPRWTSERSLAIGCRPDQLAPDPTKQTTFSANYALNDIKEPYSSACVAFLGELLAAGESSPFHRSLLDAGIGSDYSPDVGTNSYTRDAFFSIGLHGISKDDVTNVSQIINQTFDDVINHGIPVERVEGVLHRHELALKHERSNFGLNFLMSIAPQWIHGASMEHVLKINDMVARFRDDFRRDSSFLSDLVQQYFKTNKHKLMLTMSPDPAFAEDLQRREDAKLDEKVSTLPGADKALIYDLGLQLERTQDREEDLSCLPSLKLSDINKKIVPEVTKTHLLHGSVETQVGVQTTNGITYLRLLCNAVNLPEHHLPFLPLFCAVVTRMGADDLDYHALSQLSERTCSELNASPILRLHPEKDNVWYQGVLLDCFFLNGNMEKSLDLWMKIFTSTHYDEEDRLSVLVRMAAADISASLTHNGHMYAIKAASSLLSQAFRTSEILSGLTQVTVMKHTAEMKDLSSVIEILKDIGRVLLCKDNVKCALNVSATDEDGAVQQLQSFLASLPSTGRSRNGDAFAHQVSSPAGDSLIQRIYYNLPFSVHYASAAIPTCPYTHVDAPSLSVLGKLMTNDFLHREIREKGGAYGGGVASDTRGCFAFYSYRDPSFAASLESFTRAGKWASDGNFNEDDVERAKLRVLQEIDRPVTPGNFGMTFFLDGVTDNMRQTYKNGVMSATKDLLVDASKRYLTNPTSVVQGVTVLGPENSDIEQNPDWKTFFP